MLFFLSNSLVLFYYPLFIIQPMHFKTCSPVASLPFFQQRDSYAVHTQPFHSSTFQTCFQIQNMHSQAFLPSNHVPGFKPRKQVFGVKLLLRARKTGYDSSYLRSADLYLTFRTYKILKNIFLQALK